METTDIDFQVTSSSINAQRSTSVVVSKCHAKLLEKQAMCIS